MASMILSWLVGSYGTQFLQYLGSAAFSLMGDHYKEKVLGGFRDYIL